MRILQVTAFVADYFIINMEIFDAMSIYRAFDTFA
jgi:hypothetical protein